MKLLKIMKYAQIVRILTTRSQATLLSNIGTCSLAICDQQASLPIKPITGT